ncbi:MAG: hypothetical protein VX986_05510 [Pseudomonadota bacterium]|nr:hypothetical protein [Pseudomonadota bacterium]
MSRITFRIPRLYKYLFFAFLSLSWFSGTIFYYLNNWGEVDGPFGFEKHPAQFPVLMVHGAGAFLLILSFGALLTSHVPAGWRLNRSRYIGLMLITLFSFQIVTAYLLYYVAWEEGRTVLANLHAAVGFSIPFLLMTHIFIGRKNRRP